MSLPVRPSGPRGTLLTGNLSGFARDPLGFLSHAARVHGPVASLRFGRSRAMLLSEPSMIEEVLVRKRSSFIKARPLRAQHRLFGEGLLTNEGESWKQQRRLAQPAFHPARMTGYAPAMVRRTADMLDGWIPGSTIDVHAQMKTLLMNIAAETMFGAEVASHAARIGVALEATMDRYAGRRGIARLIPDSVPVGAARRYVAGVREIDSFVTATIASRRESGRGNGDLLGMLLGARDESGNPMSSAQVRDEAITLFVGGFDTPALCLSWTWYLLASHPEVAARLRAEVDMVLGDRVPGAEDVASLALTQRIVKESMRLYPPAWLISREAIAETDIGGVSIPRGTSVLMSQWVMHRDERFFADPLAFLPERWNDGASSQPRFAYFPFGGGPRVCIGAAFAMMETTLVLAMIAQRFRFELAQAGEIAPHATMTLRPRGGVPARVVPRTLGSRLALEGHE